MKSKLLRRDKEKQYRRGVEKDFSHCSGGPVVKQKGRGNGWIGIERKRGGLGGKN